MPSSKSSLGLGTVPTGQMFQDMLVDSTVKISYESDYDHWTPGQRQLATAGVTHAGLFPAHTPATGFH